MQKSRVKLGKTNVHVAVVRSIKIVMEDSSITVYEFYNARRKSRVYAIRYTINEI